MLLSRNDFAFVKRVFSEAWQPAQFLAVDIEVLRSASILTVRPPNGHCVGRARPPPR